MTTTLEAPRSPAQLAERVARDAALLAVCETQLVAAQNGPALREFGKQAAAVGGIVVALLAAFSFVNWALADALSGPLPGWRAPLVLAAAWTAVAVIVTVILLGGERSAKGWFARVTKTEDEIPQRELAVAQAEQELRQDLEDLSEAIALAAEHRLAAALLPFAGGVVAVGEDMVEAAGDVFEASEEVVELLEESVPGGIIMRDVIDVALYPARLGVRVARIALKLDSNGAGSPETDL